MAAAPSFTSPSLAANAPRVMMRFIFVSEQAVLDDPGELLGDRASGPERAAFGIAAQIPEPSTRLWLESFWNGGDVTVGVESTTGASGFGDLVRAAGYDVHVIEDAGTRLVAEDALPIDLEGFHGMQIVEVTSRTAPARAEPPLIVFGLGEQVPGVIAIANEEAALLDPDRSGLPGVVSPYDLTRTLARMLGIEVADDAPGASLSVVPDPDAIGKVGALRDRFVRDRAWRAPLSQISVGVIVVACLLGIVAAVRRDRLAVARRSGGLIVGAFLGSLVATLLPLGGLGPRIVVLLVVVAIGGVRPDARIYTIAAVAMTVALVGLTIVAAVRGQGEPALSLWPSPLEASRASGLLNGYVVLLVGSSLTLFALGRGSPWMRASAAAVVVAVIGAPQLGANFGGVVFAVVAFGVAFAYQRAGTLRIRDLVLVGLVGAAFLAGSLLLDLGDQTHGGRLVDTIGSDGMGVIWDVLVGRWQTSSVVTGRFGAIAWFGFWAMLPILLVGLVGVISPRRVPLMDRISVRARAAVAGLLFAAFTALLLEDTGFLTAGSLLGFIVAIVLYDIAPWPPHPSRDRALTGAPA